MLVNMREKFIQHVTEENPLHVNFLNWAIGKSNEESRHGLDEYLAYCADRGIGLDILARSYNTLVSDMQMSQIYFRRHGKYEHSKYSEVADKVYHDPDYMTRYMQGLAISTFIWPNHARMMEFFTRTFPKSIGGTYLEVGPGHGYFFLRAAKMGAFERLTGIDISVSSLRLTREILEHFAADILPRVELKQVDFLTDPLEEPFSCIVMGEVIEHLEEPERFLRRIAELSDANTHIFVSTAINSPAIDHIYLFRSSEEVEAMINRAGLAVKDKCLLGYADKSLQDTMNAKLPVNAAYTLVRA